MLVKPTIHFGQDVRGVMHAIAQQRRSHKRDFGASQNALDQIPRAMHSAGYSQVGAHMAAEDGSPMQAEKQFFGTA